MGKRPPRSRPPRKATISPVARGGPPRAAPTVLCAGIAVLDFIFRVERFPTPGIKAATSNSS